MTGQFSDDANIPFLAEQTLSSAPKDYLPDAQPNTKVHSVHIVIQSVDKVYTDVTVFFPYTSSLGFKYIFILYHYDSNSILSEPLRNRSVPELLCAYTKLYSYLSDRVFPFRYIG